MIESPALCFFAHPDDETLAAGGTIARLAIEGIGFAFAIPATGIAGRVPLYLEENEGITDVVQERIEDLQQNCAKALLILGVESVVCFGGFPDNRLDSVPLQDLIHWLENVMADVQPRTILTHSPTCLNIDHRRCYEAVMVATRQSDITVLCGEVPGSTRILGGWRPNFYVKLEQEYVNRKIAAMESYESERRISPHPRSPEMLIALARVRGAECGAGFAEGFMIQRCII